MTSMFANLQQIKSNTLADDIKMIDITELHDSKDNFFEVTRVEEFAETILGQGGVKDNLIVRKIDSGYEIISGHRRKAAVQYLLDNGKNISRYLPCLVQTYQDEDQKLLDLILMNISARAISDAELVQCYEIVDGIFKRKKETGEKFGRVREKLAEVLGVSPAQVGKIQNVENHAVPEVMEAVRNGDISLSTANQLAKFSEEKQQEYVDKDLKTVKNKELEKELKKLFGKDTKKVDTCINSSNTTLKKEKTDTDVSEFIEFLKNNYFTISALLKQSNTAENQLIIKLLSFIDILKEKG